MATTSGQIFAFSGILSSSSDTRTNADLMNYALGLSGTESGHSVCYVPTAVGDSPVAIEAESKEFAEHHPDVAFSALTLFNQPNVTHGRRMSGARYLTMRAPTILGAPGSIFSAPSNSNPLRR